MNPDSQEFNSGDGPATMAAQFGQLAKSLAQWHRTETRWPRFALAMGKHTPARDMLSLRLFLTESDRAALNLYTTRPGTFTDQSVATASMFAAYGSMALLAAARGDQVNHLTRALGTNREIGVAMAS